MSGAARTQDFLDRTVDKAFGRQTAIDPRLPSVFEPRGFGLEAQDSLPAAQPVAARGGREIPAGSDRTRPGDNPRPHPRAALSAEPALAARATAAADQERDIPASQHEPTAVFEMTKPANLVPARSDGGPPMTVRAAKPDTKNSATAPKQMAALRPQTEAAAATAAAVATAATVAGQRAAAEDDDVRVAEAAAPNPPPAAATQTDGRVRWQSMIAPKPLAVAQGEFGIHRAAMATTPPGTASDPGAAVQSQRAEDGAVIPQRPAGDGAVVRPVAERGIAVRSPRAKAAVPPQTEQRAPPADDEPARQGALLPIVMPVQRASAAQILAPQRRTPPAPQGGEAREASVVNVTIGRVEVRATGTAAQRSGEKREPKPLSLAEYLKKRSER
jgi:hypothetical protein